MASYEDILARAQQAWEKWRAPRAAEPSAAWENEQREMVADRVRNPQPNDIIERRAELRDSGMDDD